MQCSVLIGRLPVNLGTNTLAQQKFDHILGTIPGTVVKGRPARNTTFGRGVPLRIDQRLHGLEVAAQRLEKNTTVSQTASIHSTALLYHT